MAACSLVSALYTRYVSKRGHTCTPAVMAAVSVANIVKSSLGPVGLDKMLVDDVGVRREGRREGGYVDR